MCAAAAPSVDSRRCAISPAALLVKVKAQMRAGSTSSCCTRWRTRSIRQYVLPAPGPARTSSGPAGAVIAARCESDAVRAGGAKLSRAADVVTLELPGVGGVQLRFGERVSVDVESHVRGGRAGRNVELVRVERKERDVVVVRLVLRRRTRAAVARHPEVGIALHRARGEKIFFRVAGARGERRRA